MRRAVRPEDGASRIAGADGVIQDECIRIDVEILCCWRVTLPQIITTDFDIAASRRAAHIRDELAVGGAALAGVTRRIDEAAI